MTDKSDPGAEPAVFIETLHTRGFRHEYRSNRTAGERHPIDPRQIWNSMDPTDIPDTNPVPEAGNADNTAVGFVTLRKRRPLTQVANNTATGALVFQTTVPTDIMEVIPGAWGANGSYQPVLRDANSAVIPYDPQMWTIDGINHTLEFPQNAAATDGLARDPATGLPAGFTAPFDVTYWVYNGSTGGAGGGAGEANTGANIGTGEGLFINKTGVVLNFKTLTAGKDITLDTASAPNEIIINSDASTFEVTQAAHGLALGDAVFLNDATTDWEAAQADDVNTLGTHIVVRVVDANTFCVSNNGPFAYPAHGLGGPGVYLYVSAATPGGLTSTAPSPPDFNNPIAQVLDAGTLLVLPYRASRIGIAGAGALGTVHLTASDSQHFTGGASAGTYGGFTGTAAISYPDATAAQAALATRTPSGYTGSLPTVRVLLAATAVGVARLRLGFQDLGAGASVAAYAPTMVAGLTSVVVGAADTVVSATLPVPAIGALAANRPFALVVERDGTDGADILIGDVLVHDVILTY